MVDEKWKLLGEITKRMKKKPTVVGGAAVELYTRGAHVTGDIDLIADRKEIVRVLKGLGFQKEGMYFIKGPVFVHVVGMDTDFRTVDMKIKGVSVAIRIVGVEDMIVDRLNACRWWESGTDCEQAQFLINVHYDDCDVGYLRKRARTEQVLDLLEEMVGNKA